MLTKEDLLSIKGLLDEQNKEINARFDKLDARMDRLEERMTKLEERVTKLEERVTKLEERVTKLETQFGKLEMYYLELDRNLRALSDYTYKKFALIENDMYPKISALFDARDLCVQRSDCQRMNEDIERKLTYVKPLVRKVKEHGRKLDEHDTILKKLVKA